jgi:outer membrane protein OmpA-like peptidoglycan-associated protein
MISVLDVHRQTRGSKTNQTLSTERANAVREYLVQHDIAADRITAVGHGEERSVVENTSAEGRANKRRVEIVVKAGNSH